MQSAFVDIGLERTGFLHISDLVETVEDLDVALRIAFFRKIQLIHY